MKDNTLFQILIWLVSLITALTVGSEMINKNLTIPGIPEFVTFIGGWIVVVGIIIAAILTVFSE